MTSLFLMFSFSSCLSRESSPLTKERLNGAFSEDIEPACLCTLQNSAKATANCYRSRNPYSQSSVVLINAALTLNIKIKTKCERNRERTTTYTVRSPTFSTYKIGSEKYMSLQTVQARDTWKARIQLPFLSADFPLPFSSDNTLWMELTKEKFEVTTS